MTADKKTHNSNKSGSNSHNNEDESQSDTNGSVNGKSWAQAKQLEQECQS